jgi:hypothetical protein
MSNKSNPARLRGTARLRGSARLDRAAAAHPDAGTAFDMVRRLHAISVPDNHPH